jgi:hypothetical protein
MNFGAGVVLARGRIWPEDGPKAAPILFVVVGGGYCKRGTIVL